MSEMTHCANCAAEVPVDKPHRVGECHWPTVTLTEFLLARIAEDEAEAKRAGADAMVGFRWKHYPEDAYIEVQSLTLAHSRRVLAECEAKRRIVAIGKCLNLPVGGLGVEVYMEALALLALPYADHPDYREEWKP